MRILALSVLLAAAGCGANSEPKPSVLDGAGGKQIGERDAASLQHRVYPAGAREATNVLQTGQAALVFMHVPLADENQVPEQLTQTSSRSPARGG